MYLSILQFKIEKFNIQKDLMPIKNISLYIFFHMRSKRHYSQIASSSNCVSIV